MCCENIRDLLSCVCDPIPSVKGVFCDYVLFGRGDGAPSGAPEPRNAFHSNRAVHLNRAEITPEQLVAAAVARAAVVVAVPPPPPRAAAPAVAAAAVGGRRARGHWGLAVAALRVSRAPAAAARCVTCGHTHAAVLDKHTTTHGTRCQYRSTGGVWQVVSIGRAHSKPDKRVHMVKPQDRVQLNAGGGLPSSSGAAG